MSDYNTIKSTLAPHLPDNMAIRDSGDETTTSDDVVKKIRAMVQMDDRPPPGERRKVHGEKKQKVAASLPPEVTEYFREQGNGNVSLGMRNVAYRDMLHTKGVNLVSGVFSDPDSSFSTELYRRAVMRVRDNPVLREQEQVLTGNWMADDEYWAWLLSAPVQEVIDTLNRIRDEVKREEQG